MRLALGVFCVSFGLLAGCAIGPPAPSVDAAAPVAVHASAWAAQSRIDADAAGAFERQTAAGEAQVYQMAFQHIHRPFVGRRDGRNADQVAGQFDRIDNGS